MRKIFTWAASILILVAFAWNWIGVTDEIKLARFERLCREHATEDVRENSADGTVILSGTGLEERLEGWKIAGTFRQHMEPIGAARLPALDLEYDPAAVLPNLFHGSDSLRVVAYSRSSIGRAIDIPEACREPHLLLVSSEQESEAAIHNRGDDHRVIQTRDGIRYYIGLAYGDLDFYEIRPFIFYLKDRLNGRILAEQRSYQILLGGMSHHRILHGWGSSQGVKTCGLTPPDQLIKRAFR